MYNSILKAEQLGSSIFTLYKFEWIRSILLRYLKYNHSKCTDEHAHIVYAPAISKYSDNINQSIRCT